MIIQRLKKAQGILKQYLFFFKAGFHHERREGIGAICARFGFFWITLIVFSQIWRATLQDYTLTGMNISNLIWHITITEWIVISIPHIHIQIDRDFRTGNMIYFLVRPNSYLWAKIWENFGILTWRVLYLGFFGTVFSSLFSNQIPSVQFMIVSFFMVLVSGFVCLLFQASIGVLSYWIQDVMPFYWIWQKSNFVLGGLTIPLVFYPEWLQEVSGYFPFSIILNDTAQSLVFFDWGKIAIVLGKLVDWILFAIILQAYLFHQAVQNIQVKGE